MSVWYCGAVIERGHPAHVVCPCNGHGVGPCPYLQPPFQPIDFEPIVPYVPIAPAPFVKPDAGEWQRILDVLRGIMGTPVTITATGAFVPAPKWTGIYPPIPRGPSGASCEVGT